MRAVTLIHNIFFNKKFLKIYRIQSFIIIIIIVIVIVIVIVILSVLHYERMK